MGNSPSHIVSAVKPDDIEAAGRFVTDITIGADTAVQLFTFVTSTVIWSPVTKSFRVRELFVELAPKLMLFLKNS